MVLVCRLRKEVSLSDRGNCQKVLCGAGKTDNFILESTARIASTFVSLTAVHIYDLQLFSPSDVFRQCAEIDWG